MEEISKLDWIMVLHKHAIRHYYVCLTVDIARFTHRDSSNCQEAENSSTTYLVIEYIYNNT